MLPKEEKNLLLLTLGLIILSIPHILSTNFAGIVYPPAKELILEEYDWMVSPGTDACYTYSYLGNEHSNCTTVNESGWILISEGGRTVKFFVEANETAGITEPSQITLTSMPSAVTEYEDINLTYVVKNGLAKGRVFHITYTLDGVQVGGRYLRMLPKETSEIADTIHAQKAGDYALAVQFGDTYDAGRVRVSPRAGSMNIALGLPIAFLSFIIPFLILSSVFLRNKGHLPLLSLTLFTAFVSLLNLFDAFDKNSSYTFIGILWGVSLVAGIIYKK